MPVPHFIIIGACKSGTTTLYDDLCGHPGVHMPDVKEPDILHRAPTVQGARKLYTRHFGAAPHGSLCGEGSTYYTMQPQFDSVASHALAVCGPSLKLIYIIRDPIDRIVSHIFHDMGAGRTKEMTADALVLNNSRYIAWSDYAIQLSDWVQTFGPDNVLLLRFEDLIRERAATAARAVEFIGLDPKQLPRRTAVSNARGSQARFTSSVVQRLAQTSLYQFGMRRVLPSGLRKVLKARLMRRDLLPPVVLSEKLQAELRERFAGQDEALADLLGNAAIRPTRP